MKILIHGPNWLGDHIMAFPFYTALKSLFPGNSQFHLIGRSWINNLVPANLFSKVYTTSRSLPPKELKQKLSAEKYDLAITLSPSFRSAFLFWQCKIPIRIGYKTDMRHLFLKYPTQTGSLRIPKLNMQEHRSLSYIRLLTNFFSNDLIAEDYWQKAAMAPQLPFIEKHILNTSYVKKLTAFKNTYWVICPGSVGSSKIYPSHYLAEVIIQALNQNRKLYFVFVGSAIESKYATEIISQIPSEFQNRLVDLCAKTSLSEVFLILKEAQGLIANDSGIAHMSYLSQTPLITFIGMARKEETLTLNPRKIVLNKNLKCSPCMSAVCRANKNKIECLTSIQPSEVLHAMKLLGLK